MIFAGFEPRCEKCQDHFQIQEAFVATVYGLSTIQSDLFEIIWFCTIHTQYFLLLHCVPRGV